MTREQKIQYLRIALALQKINVPDQIADQLIETMDVIERKGGDFSIKDAVEIEFLIGRKWAEKQLTENQEKP